MHWVDRSLLIVFVGLFSIGCGGVGAPVSPVSPAAASDPGKILSASELAKIVDLSKLPEPKGAEFNTRLPSQLSATSTLGPKAAMEFYVQALEQQRWKISSDPNSKAVYEGSASAALEKDGYRAYVSTFESEPGKCMIQVLRQGKLDLKTLPRTPGSKPLYEGATSNMYVAQGTVAAEKKFVTAELRKAGWQEYTRPNTAKAEDPNQWIANFRNQGYTLSVFCSVAPAQDNKTSMQYAIGTLSHEFPSPPDVETVEFDDEKPEFMCQTKDDLATTEKFYREAMPKAGYTTLTNEEPTERRVLLRFESPDKDIVLVDLTREAEATATNVRFVWFPAAVIQKMKAAEEKASLKAEKE